MTGIVMHGHHLGCLRGSRFDQAVYILIKGGGLSGLGGAILLITHRWTVVASWYHGVL